MEAMKAKIEGLARGVNLPKLLGLPLLLSPLALMSTLVLIIRRGLQVLAFVIVDLLLLLLNISFYCFWFTNVFSCFLDISGMYGFGGIWGWGSCCKAHNKEK